MPSPPSPQTPQTLASCVPRDREATGVRVRTPRSAWGSGRSDRRAPPTAPPAPPQAPPEAPPAPPGHTWGSGRSERREPPSEPPQAPPPPSHSCRSTTCSRNTTTTTTTTTGGSTIGTTSTTTGTTSGATPGGSGSGDRSRRPKRATVNIKVLPRRESSGTSQNAASTSNTPGGPGKAATAAPGGNRDAGGDARRASRERCIRLVRYSSRSAGRSLDAASPPPPPPGSDPPAARRRPVRRHIRVRIVSDQERALNLRADGLSSDISVPRAWPPSQSLVKAQRQVRTQERRLAETLDGLDKDLAAKVTKVTKSERRLLNEFLSKYPDMYGQVTSGLSADRATLRRIGVFPPPSAARDGNFRRLTDAAVQEAEAAIIRAQLRTPGGGQFPPLVKRKVHVSMTSDPVQPPSSPRRKSKPRGTLRSKSTSGGMQLEGVRCEEPRSDKPEIEAVNSNNKGNNSPESDLSGVDGSRTSTFIRTPGKGASQAKGASHPSAPPPDPQNVNVSVFVDTDFGFHPERMRTISGGMTLQKDIRDTSQLERDIEKVARKHIDAAMTSGLNARACRKAEGVTNLRAVIVGRRQKQRLPGEPEMDEISLTGSGRSSTTARVVLSPRKGALRSGGALPPLDKDVSKINVVGKSDGPLVAQVNIAVNSYMD